MLFRVVVFYFAVISVRALDERNVDSSEHSCSSDDSSEASSSVESSESSISVSSLDDSSDLTLRRRNVDKSKISVSGVSSGGAFATQIHVIYSSDFMGVGVISGLPFNCTQGGGKDTAIFVCLYSPSLISVSDLVATTDAAASVSDIDAVSNMRKDKVYIFNGKLDTVANPEIGPVIERYYSNYVENPERKIKTVFDMDAEHGMPTLDYGAPCDTRVIDFMNNCNYSAAFDLLNHIYGGNLKEPSANAKQKGQLLRFNQSEFFDDSSPELSSMDDIGYVYVPRKCAKKTRKCNLHVAFHGCRMGQRYINDTYVIHGGYNEVADRNKIIILYPQAIITFPNPSGCWDWWGYTGENFATNKGVQPMAIKKMVERITG